MANIFDLISVDLPPELKSNILKAHRAKVTDKAIAKYLGVPLREVKRVFSEDEKRSADLDQWAQALRYTGSSASDT